MGRVADEEDEGECEEEEAESDRAIVGNDEEQPVCAEQRQHKAERGSVGVDPFTHDVTMKSEVRVGWQHGRACMQCEQWK